MDSYSVTSYLNVTDTYYRMTEWRTKEGLTTYKYP